ncbi:MAG: zf-HC2 domain-containing protein [Gemmatimonadales bacterium]|nr:zf-HC2 domain-containing protein [Gemmatimonadales bacterium]
MTTCSWTDRLSEYLDGELEASEREALARHLGSCASCPALLQELRDVVAAARALPDLPPARDLWPAVAERTTGPTPLRARHPSPAIRNRAPLAAAAALLLAVGAGTTWLALGGRPAQVAAPAPTVGAPPTTVPAATATRRGTADAVADLERLLVQSSGQLDSGTARVVAENLARIDSALAAAHAALATDSSNAYVRRHLADTERRKVELLRTAARLVQART